MVEQKVLVNADDLAQVRKDVELLKSVLLSERELTDWAKKALIEARKESEDSYVSLDEL